MTEVKVNNKLSEYGLRYDRLTIVKNDKKYTIEKYIILDVDKELYSYHTLLGLCSKIGTYIEARENKQQLYYTNEYVGESEIFNYDNRYNKIADIIQSSYRYSNVPNSYRRSI